MKDMKKICNDCECKCFDCKHRLSCGRGCNHCEGANVWCNNTGKKEKP